MNSPYINISVIGPYGRPCDISLAIPDRYLEHRSPKARLDVESIYGMIWVSMTHHPECYWEVIHVEPVAECHNN